MDLEAGISSLRIALILNLVAEGANFTGKRVAIDLRKIGPAFVNLRRLQRLPAAFRSVVGQVRADGVGVQLWIELAAGVVVVNGERQVCGRPVPVGATLPYPASRVRLGFFQGLCDGG